jgi:hypothetical protein
VRAKENSCHYFREYLIVREPRSIAQIGNVSSGLTTAMFLVDLLDEIIEVNDGQRSGDPIPITDEQLRRYSAASQMARAKETAVSDNARTSPQ